MLEGNGAPTILKPKTYRGIRIKANCHPSAGLEAVFIQERLLLIMRCATCQVEVMRAEVAKEFTRANSDSNEDNSLVKLG